MAADPSVPAWLSANTLAREFHPGSPRRRHRQHLQGHPLHSHLPRRTTLANICRSPVTEAMFCDVVEKRGLLDSFRIDSAGTIGYHED